MHRSRIAARLRRGFRRARQVEPPADRAVPVPAERAAAALRGLGEPPSAPREQAAEAELDTLRGELVRELDLMADGDHGSGSFRRTA